MELTGFDQSCLELLDQSPQTQSRACLRSAINHLRRTEATMPVDRPMAVFRCYTAEEEAASGLMHCLKERQYANADSLKPRNHVHKNAVIPFLTILKKFFDESLGIHGVEPEIQLREVDRQRQLFLAVPIVVSGEKREFVPNPPLNFSVTNQARRVSYNKQIDEYVRARGASEVDDHLREMANKRNLVLYAGPNGYPADIEITDKFFPAYCARVLAIVRAYLLIQPHPERQSYVQDSLDAFLAMLGLLTFNEEL
jgi:hypothetical protein